ncbi:unnamed protein product [Amoebophrya sp. A120]|nr:unnamed protein product [Amoebophrya sp. A120]|eukprot:GSA120T00000377001.1
MCPAEEVMNQPRPAEEQRRCEDLLVQEAVTPNAKMEPRFGEIDSDAYLAGRKQPCGTSRKSRSRKNPKHQGKRDASARSLRLSRSIGSVYFLYVPLKTLSRSEGRRLLQ